MDEEKNDVIYIPARKCLRCGGILTSKQGIRDGFGCVCKKKYKQEQARLAPGQITLFDDASWQIDDDKKEDDPC